MGLFYVFLRFLVYFSVFSVKFSSSQVASVHRFPCCWQSLASDGLPCRKFPLGTGNDTVKRA